MSPELTRSFRALKVWFYLRTYGFGKLSRIVEQYVRQARRLECLVSDHADLELLVPASLNVVFSVAGGALERGGTGCSQPRTIDAALGIRQSRRLQHAHQRPIFASHGIHQSPDSHERPGCPG